MRTSRARANSKSDPKIEKQLKKIEKLRAAMKNHLLVRFDYINRDNKKVTYVTANVLSFANINIHSKLPEIAEFGVIKTANSKAHPGFRPIRISNLRNIRVLKSPSTRILAGSW